MLRWLTPSRRSVTWHFQEARKADKFGKMLSEPRQTLGQSYFAAKSACAMRCNAGPMVSRFYDIQKLSYMYHIESRWTSVSQVSKLHQRQSIRTYIFIENLWDKLFFTEKRKNMRQREKIIVALRKQRSRLLDSFAVKTEERAGVGEYSDVTSSATARDKIKQWGLAKRERMKLYYNDRKSRLKDDTATMLRSLREKSNNAKARWELQASGRWNKFINQTRRRRERIKGRFRSIASMYTKHAITIDEPFRKDWFTAQGYPLASKDPYTDRYVNPWNSESTNGFKTLEEVWRWKKTRMVGFLDVSPSSSSSLSSSLVSLKTKDEMKRDALVPIVGKIKLTWVGHATNLVHFSDKFTILTDPIFSNKASPFQFFQQSEFFGVPRWQPPSLTVDDLNIIDVVVISHDHYDHLDLGSVKDLKERAKVHFWAVPMGTKDWLINNIGINEDSIIELEWWQSVKIVKDANDLDKCPKVVSIQTVLQHDESNNDVGCYQESKSNELTITCAPAQHWCSRSPFDRNTRLWCSWAIQANLVTGGKTADFSTNLNFYFAGDTGYPENFPLHRQIGDLLGPFDLAAIPIGAYKPRFFMKDSHCDPKEAVKIHKDIRSKRSVAIHWGTFPLANEPLEEPPTLLRSELGDDSHDEFIAIPHGDSIYSFNH